MDQQYEGRVLTTLRDDGSRIWLRPRRSDGRFLHRRRIVGYGLIVLFLVLPFVDVGGHPAILLDVVARRFHLFGLTLHPTDSVLLMLLMLGIFIGIFWLTALFGRVWCGWGCPQTVYMELIFRPLERLIEGDIGQQRLLDKRAFSGRRWIKYVIFLAIAFVLGHQFLAYFVGWPRLVVWMTEPPWVHPSGFGVVIATTGLVFFDFAYFREQMCTVVCPYARLQSALLDRHSLIVGYDEHRGEARRRVKARRPNDDSGDCIDCGACVRTCPTGIDIRQGLQLECIQCAQCIDACDQVMDRVGSPRGLIRLSSQHGLQTTKGSPVVRPRTVIYPVIIAVLTGLLVYLVTTRSPADVTVLRQLNAPFVLLDDGHVRNQLRVKIVNRTDQPRTYSLSMAGFETSDILAPQFPLTVAARGSATSPIFVHAPRDRFKQGSLAVAITVTDSTGLALSTPYVLLGPQ